jgi:hypothetical protein
MQEGPVSACHSKGSLMTLPTKNKQEPPGAPRSPQEPPVAPRSPQPRSPQEPPGAPRSLQEPPGVPGNHQKPPGTTKRLFYETFYGHKSYRIITSKSDSNCHSLPPCSYICRQGWSLPKWSLLWESTLTEGSQPCPQILD